MNWIFQENLRSWYETAVEDEYKLVVKEVDDRTEWLAEIYSEVVKDEEGNESYDIHWAAGTAASLGAAQEKAERARELLIELRDLEMSDA